MSSPLIVSRFSEMPEYPEQEMCLKIRFIIYKKIFKEKIEPMPSHTAHAFAGIPRSASTSEIEVVLVDARRRVASSSWLTETINFSE